MKKESVLRFDFTKIYLDLIQILVFSRIFLNSISTSFPVPSRLSYYKRDVALIARETPGDVSGSEVMGNHGF